MKPPPPPPSPPLEILIPGLPYDISALILSYIPIPFHGRLKPTSKSWYSFFSSQNTLLFSLRNYHLTPPFRSHLLCLFPQDPSLTSPFLFDPVNLAWSKLPPLPVNPYVYALCNFQAISVGSHLYVIGGSLFDTRSFPLDRPTSCGSGFRFDFRGYEWVPIAPMITPRGSFACGVVVGDVSGGSYRYRIGGDGSDGSGGTHQYRIGVVGDDGSSGSHRYRIVVAGGGSRHAMFEAAGSRVRGVEGYDVERDEWVSLPGLPEFRAGCVGFCVGRKEFWVMGGYGRSRTISGVLPVDEHYRDALVMDFDDGKWREVGDMWEKGERPRLGKIVVDDYDGGGCGCELPLIFMLDGNDIFRYNMGLNRWFKESTVPRPANDGSRFGFIALQGELHVISPLHGSELSEIRRLRHWRRGTAVLFMQIYNPRMKSWRSLVTRTPFHGPLDFKTAVMCTICV